MRLEAWIFLLTFSYRGKSIMQWNLLALTRGIFHKNLMQILSWLQHQKVRGSVRVQIMLCPCHWQPKKNVPSVRQVLKSKGQVLINCVCNCDCPTHTCSISGAKTNAFKRDQKHRRLERSVVENMPGKEDQTKNVPAPTQTPPTPSPSSQVWIFDLDPSLSFVAFAFFNIWHVFKLMRRVFTHLSYFRRREKSFQCHYSLPSYFELWSVLYLSKEIFICISCHAGISCKICWWQCPKVHETYSTKKYETPFSNLESDFPSKEIRNY